MKQPFIILIFVGCMVALSVYLYLRGRRKRQAAVEATYPVPIPSTFAFQQLTPGNVWVCSVVDVPLAAMHLIDAGIAIQIDKSAALHPDWKPGSLRGDYELIFIEPMATNVETDPGSPALLVYGQQAAGTCIGTQPGGRPIIVLPHQAATNWSHTDYLRESARNESEHVRLALNDRDLFDHYQGANDVHPIFP